MNYDLLFELASNTVVFGWLALAIGIFVSTGNVWRVRLMFIAGRIVPALVAAIYIYCLIKAWGTTNGSMTSFAGVAQLMAAPQGALVIWVHILVVDLVAGRWMADDAQARNVSAWLLLPFLLVTLLFAPAGLLAYFCLQAMKRPG